MIREDDLQKAYDDADEYEYPEPKPKMDINKLLLEKYILYYIDKSLSRGTISIWPNKDFDLVCDTLKEISSSIDDRMSYINFEGENNPYMVYKGETIFGKWHIIVYKNPQEQDY